MRARPTRLLILLAVAAMPVLASGAVLAEDAAPPPAEQEQDAGNEPDAAERAGAARSVLFERVRVVGSPDENQGSVSYLNEARLAQHGYADVNRILSQVPGINIQEEEGYGLRPNIGMRGSGSQRSAKITLLEDGVLIAPAPYSAPAAYYFPTAGRMEGVEVRKGSSSIQHGPHTNGGVINFVSSSIPSDEFGGSVNVAFGDNDTLRGRVKAGGSSQRLGWLVESYRWDTTGFKRLDTGGDTGFDLEDYLVKLRLSSSPRARRFQALEVKAGTTEQSGRETYLGLTDGDFQRDPFRRYAASQMDNIETDHDQLQARYVLRFNDKIDFSATAYRNDFFRNWRKLGHVNGIDIGEVLSDPVTHAAELAILRADLTADSADDVLAVRNNRRDYFSHGVQFILGVKPGGTGSSHSIQIGLNLHEDEEDRFQEDERFKMTADGRMLLTTMDSPGSQSNRVADAAVVAGFVRDTIRVGNLTVTPGVRFEDIDLRRVDYADAARTTVSAVRLNHVAELIPGVGFNYQLERGSSIFGGIHRGFSPPGPGSTDADAETSVNYELGFRREKGALDAQVIGFFNDYDNLLGVCTVSSGCNGADVGDVFNGGEVRTSGIEASLNYDAGKKLPVAIPLSLTYTFTEAEFRNSFKSEYDPWGNVQSGFGLPYLPEHQASLGAGVADTRWSVYANLAWVDEMRTVAGQGPIPRDSSTDAHLLLDVSASYRLRPQLKLFVQGRNLTDEVYVAARRPAGARPGIDRTLLAGVALDF